MSLAVRTARRFSVLVFFVVTVSYAFVAAGQPHATPERTARARALFEQGQQAYGAGDLNTALAKMLEASRLVALPELSFNIARIYERTGDAANAIRYYRAYLQAAHPSNDERADIARRLEAMQALARRQREQIFAAPPTGDELTNEARTFFMRGAALFQRRQYRAALEAFEAANTFTRLPEVQYNLGVIRERLGEAGDAVLHYEEYLRMRPDTPDAAAIRAKITALRARRGR